ncbi:MAG: hypothetical protein JNL98_27840 [Bryobacterales bacterium]|nr:hypothetical protein [Bryobacterales bacterium]
MWVILLPALIFRLTAWWLEPSFTDDLYRYRWESRLQLAGGNPYAMPPKDPSVAGLRDETYARIPGHDFRAVYGPLTEHVYREAFRLIQYSTGDPARQIFWLKLPSAVFELGLMAGLWGLLGALGIARERILIYAWAPLPIFEFWGNGHNDTLALCALVLALLAAVKHRWTLAFLTLGLSAAAKIWPLGLVPLFWRPSRWRESLVLPVAGILLMLPFGEGLLSNVRFLSGFLGGWRNNDSLYGLLLWATGDQYLAKYLAFALVFGAILLAVVQSMSLTKGTLLVTTVMLLVSANCHPWYVTWLLPMLVFHPSLALLAWSGLIPLAYRVLPAWQLLGEWNGSTPMRWLVYGPVFALLAWEWWKLIRGRVKKILAA